MILSPRRCWSCLETFSVVTAGVGVPPASVGWKLGMLLNVLQCTEPPFATKNYVGQNVNSAKVESFVSENIYSGQPIEPKIVIR